MHSVLTTMDISFTSDVDTPLRLNHVCMKRCVSICKPCVHQTLSEDSNLHFCHIFKVIKKNSNVCTFMLHDNSIIYRLLADDVWIVSLKCNAVSSGWLVRIMATYIFIFTDCELWWWFQWINKVDMMRSKVFPPWKKNIFRQHKDCFINKCTL